MVLAEYRRPWNEVVDNHRFYRERGDYKSLQDGKTTTAGGKYIKFSPNRSLCMYTVVCQLAIHFFFAVLAYGWLQNVKLTLWH